MLPDIQPGNTKILYFFNCLLDGMHTNLIRLLKTYKKRDETISHFESLCCGILTIETSHSLLRSFCFTGQNGTFSATAQNRRCFSLSVQYYFWQSEHNLLYCGVCSNQQIRNLMTLKLFHNTFCRFCHRQSSRTGFFQT